MNMRHSAVMDSRPWARRAVAEVPIPTRTTTTRQVYVNIKAKGAKSRTTPLRRASTNRRAPTTRRNQNPALQSCVNACGEDMLYFQPQITSDLEGNYFASSLNYALNNLCHFNIPSRESLARLYLQNERKPISRKRRVYTWNSYNNFNAPSPETLTRLHSGHDSQYLNAEHSGFVLTPESPSQATLQSSNVRASAYKPTDVPDINVYPINHVNVHDSTLEQIKAVVQSLEKQIREERQANQTENAAPSYQSFINESNSYHRYTNEQEYFPVQMEPPKNPETYQRNTQHQFAAQSSNLTNLLIETICRLNRYIDIKYDQQLKQQQNQEQGQPQQQQLQKDGQSVTPILESSKSLKSKIGALSNFKPFKKKISRSSKQPIHIMPIQPVVIQTTLPQPGPPKVDIATNTRRACLVNPLSRLLKYKKKKKHTLKENRSSYTDDLIQSTRIRSSSGYSAGGMLESKASIQPSLPPWQSQSSTRDSGTTMWCPMENCRCHCGVAGSNENCQLPVLNQLHQNRKIYGTEKEPMPVQHVHVFGPAYLQGSDAHITSSYNETLQTTGIKKKTSNDFMDQSLPALTPHLPPTKSTKFSTGSSSKGYNIASNCLRELTNICTQQNAQDSNDSSIISTTSIETKCSSTTQRYKGGEKESTEQMTVQIFEQVQQKQLVNKQDKDEWYNNARKRLAELEELEAGQRRCYTDREHSYAQPELNKISEENQFTQFRLPSGARGRFSSDSSGAESGDAPMRIIATTDKAVSTSDIRSSQLPNAGKCSSLKSSRCDQCKWSGPITRVTFDDSADCSLKKPSTTLKNQKLQYFSGRNEPNEYHKPERKTTFCRAQSVEHVPKFLQLLTEIRRSRENLVPPKYSPPVRKKPVRDFDCRPLKKTDCKLHKSGGTTRVPALYPTCWN